MVRALFTVDKVPRSLARLDRSARRLEQKVPNRLRGFHIYREHLLEASALATTSSSSVFTAHSADMATIWTLYKALTKEEQEVYTREAEMRAALQTVVIQSQSEEARAAFRRERQALADEKIKAA